MVRKEAVRNDGTQLKTTNPAADRVIVEANAQAIANVRLSHRTDIRRARALVLTMLGELETHASVSATRLSKQTPWGARQPAPVLGNQPR